MHSKNDQPRFKWREKALPGPTNKKVWRMLKMHASMRYVSTNMSAEWFPRLDMWRAVERIEGKQKFGGQSVLRPHYQAEFPCEPELREFVLASCMEFLEAYYVLKNGDT